MKSAVALVLALSCFLVPAAFAQTEPAAPAPATQPAPVPADVSPEQAIARMREGLVDSFNKGDMDRLLSYLDPDVVVTWQNAEVCRGPAQVRAYYDRVMTGPNKVVQSVSAAPVVDDHHIYGDWAVSWGSMNDHFTLTDGSDLPLNSRFTATIARRGSEWKVTSFHLSVNMFDNAVLHTAIRRSALYAGLGGGATGLVIGLVAGFLIARRRRATAATQ